MRSVMTRLSLIWLLSLSLSACVTSPDSGEKPESDLDVLVMGVEAMLPPRDPAGDVKRAEDAATVEDAWTLLLDLEDVDYLHERDKERAVEFVQRAADRIKLARNPCGFWRRLFKPSECTVR